MPEQKPSVFSKGKKLAQEVMLAPAEILSGLFGINDVDEAKRKEGFSALPLSQKLNAGAQVLSAGLPFAAYIPKLVKGNVFRGAPKWREEGLNPDMYNKGDTLGWMTHAAKEPKYAEQYAFKNGVPEEYEEGEYIFNRHVNNESRPHTVAAKLDAKNIFDQYEPSNDDLVAALAALPPDRRRNYTNAWRAYGKDSPDMMRKQMAGDLIYDFNNPNIFSRTPFDGIRYDDIGKEAFAVPKPTQLHTIGGPIPDARYNPKSNAFKPSHRFEAGESGVVDKNPFAGKSTKVKINEPKAKSVDYTDGFVVFDPRDGIAVKHFKNKDDIIDFFENSKNNHLDYLPADEWNKSNNESIF